LYTVEYTRTYHHFGDIYTETERTETKTADINKLHGMQRACILFEKIIVAQLVKKFTTFYGTQRCITMFTRA
jgi:hypothetical protein